MQIFSDKKNHDSVIDTIEDPTLKAVLKYKYQLRIIAFNNKYEREFFFSFSEVTKSEVAMEISKLNAN